MPSLLSFSVDFNNLFYRMIWRCHRRLTMATSVGKSFSNQNTPKTEWKQAQCIHRKVFTAVWVACEFDVLFVLGEQNGVCVSGIAANGHLIRMCMACELIFRKCHSRSTKICCHSSACIPSSAPSFIHKIWWFYLHFAISSLFADKLPLCTTSVSDCVCDWTQRKGTHEHQLQQP